MEKQLAQAMKDQEQAEELLQNAHRAVAPRAAENGKGDKASAVQKVIHMMDDLSQLVQDIDHATAAVDVPTKLLEIMAMIRAPKPAEG